MDLDTDVEKADVIICGSGSAGLCAATWLAVYGVNVKILESRAGPLKVGQADGVQCRTVEIYESFGLSEEVLRESCHVLETTFWGPDADGNLHRTGRTVDTEPGISHQPHVLLSQARMHELLLARMQVSNPHQHVDYDHKVMDVKVDQEAAKDPGAYCVEVVTSKGGKQHKMKAKYVLGCDGAHSAVRRALGITMRGDSSDSVWGVCDIFCRTNFPDIRKKVAIKSSSGSLLVIPREGGSGSMQRFYIELPFGTIAAEVGIDNLHSAAKRIFCPFELEIAYTSWWSAYSVGQRLADRFTQHDRVFLTGDACHTHAPKAGQGMNVSLQDGYNLGWKLGAVLRCQCKPGILETYRHERGKVAADLIEFDRAYTEAFSGNHSGREVGKARSFQDVFIEAGRFTAGVAAKYAQSALIKPSAEDERIASKIIVGMRLPSAQVVRLCDAKAMQLVKAMPADGRWRLVVFPGDPRSPRVKEALKKVRFLIAPVSDFVDCMVQLAEYLDSDQGPVRSCTAAGADIDSFIETLVVLSGDRVEIEPDQIPSYFHPMTGNLRLRGIVLVA